MLFPTIDFAIFFVVVFAVNWLVRPYARTWRLFLVGASYIFYGAWDARFVLLLGGMTLGNYAAGRLIAAARERRDATDGERVRLRSYPMYEAVIGIVPWPWPRSAAVWAHPRALLACGVGANLRCWVGSSTTGFSRHRL